MGDAAMKSPNVRRLDGRICIIRDDYTVGGTPWGGRTYFTHCGDEERLKAGTKPRTRDPATCMACVADLDNQYDVWE